MASTLRHDRSCNGILPVEACRSLGLPINEDGSPGAKWPASDVLLVSIGSRRDCGQRRFCVEQSADDGTYFVESFDDGDCDTDISEVEKEQKGEHKKVRFAELITVRPIPAVRKGKATPAWLVRAGGMTLFMSPALRHGRRSIASRLRTGPTCRSGQWIGEGC